MDALCCEAGPRFCKGDSETLNPNVRAFLRYVDGKAAEGKFMKAVEDEVMRVKEHKETRREYMTYAMEIKRRELAKFKEGREEERSSIILNMLKKGMSAEVIAECVQASVEYIIELGKKNHLL